MYADLEADDVRSRWHRLVERLLPWFDPAIEQALDERTERIRQRSIAARIETEQVRLAYEAASKRVARRSTK